MNVTTNLITKTEIDKEKLKILGLFVRRMFDAKGNPKGCWRGMTWLGMGNSIVQTLNDVMEQGLDTLLVDLSPKEKQQLAENGETPSRA